MNIITDGGQAFPRNIIITGNNNDVDVAEDFGTGMSLRDWFAGMALQGWLASYSEDYVHPASDDQHQSVAKLSYIMADAMLAEREQKEEK